MIQIFNQLVSLKALVLIQAEALVTLSCFLAASRIWFWNDHTAMEEHAAWPFFILQCLIQVALLPVCFYYNGLYNFKSSRTGSQQFAGIARAIGSLGVISAALYFMVPQLMIGRGVTILGLCLTLIGVLAVRLVLDRLWQAAAPTCNVLVVGTGQLALALTQEVSRREDLKLNISAFAVTDASRGSLNGHFSGRLLISTSNLLRDVPTLGVSRVVVATDDPKDLPVAELVTLRQRGVRVDAGHEVLAALTGKIRLDTIPPGNVIFKNSSEVSKLTLIWKRALDLLLSVAGSLITAPVLLLIAIAILIDSGRPILYRQTRVGLYNSQFQLLKFRSMRADAEPDGQARWASVDDPRTTRVGAFIRSYRLDELPQFINVIRGEMSFVGPRPERPLFVSQLRSQIPHYDERHLVRPGVTGWAQVQFPYARTFSDAAQKLEYDLFYLKNMSLFFDCAIALKTLRIVLLGAQNH